MTRSARDSAGPDRKSVGDAALQERGTRRAPERLGRGHSVISLPGCTYSWHQTDGRPVRSVNGEASAKGTAHAERDSRLPAEAEPRAGSEPALRDRVDYADVRRWRRATDERPEFPDQAYGNSWATAFLVEGNAGPSVREFQRLMAPRGRNLWGNPVSKSASRSSLGRPEHSAAVRRRLRG